MPRRNSRQHDFRRRIGAAPIIQRSILVDFFRTHLRQVVTIHQAMFQKLLFEEEADVGMDLADLFKDVGKTYLRISERINESCVAEHSLQD